jgi:hypothetical protein
MKNIKILFAAALTVFAIVCFTACDVGTSVIDVAGSWSGPLTIGSESGYELSANITQTETDLGGTAGISYLGNPLTTYTVSATISDTTITGQFIGTESSFFDIDFEATVNTEGTSMDGTFYIPDSGASGTFSMTKS